MINFDMKKSNVPYSGHQIRASANIELHTNNNHSIKLSGNHSTIIEFNAKIGIQNINKILIDRVKSLHINIILYSFFIFFIVYR